MPHIGCVDYTFNRDIDVACATFDRAARRADVAIDDWLPRLGGVLDREALLRLCALDPSGQAGIAILVLRAFECSAAGWRRRLQLAVSADEQAGRVDVAPMLRTFKSAAVVVGALVLARLCAEAEPLATGPRSRALEDGVDAIVAESGRILAVLAPLRRR